MTENINFGIFQDIYEKIQAGERLGMEDGVRLYKSNDLTLLGTSRSWMRRTCRRDPRGIEL